MAKANIFSIITHNNNYLSISIYLFIYLKLSFDFAYIKIKRFFCNLN